MIVFLALVFLFVASVTTKTGTYKAYKVGHASYKKTNVINQYVYAIFAIIVIVAAINAH